MDAALGIVIILVLFVAPSVVLWLKGKRLWATLGCWTLWHWIPAVRLAKPDSWWASCYYDDAKLTEARARFSASATPATAMPAAVGDVGELEAISADEIVYYDKITRKAWRKAQRTARP